MFSLHRSYFSDDEGNLLASELFHLPSRKKHPLYYQMIEQPIDLKTIETKIFSAEYQNIESFEHDVMLLFHNVEVGSVRKTSRAQLFKILLA